MFFEEFEFDTYTVTIEEPNGTQVQTMQAPPQIVQMQFMGLLQHAASINTPARIKISRMVEVNMSQFDKENRQIEESIQFANNFWKN